mgnify:CR=1 FL=1
MNQHQKPVPLVTPNLESLVQQQIDSVLSVVDSLRPFLQSVPSFGGETPKPDLDDGVKTSVETTMIHACNRLDMLLTTEGHWKLDGHEAFVKASIEAQEAHRDFLKEQARSAAEVRRPSFQLRPTLAATSDGFIAFWGDLNTAGGAIIGRGETPAEALLDFDRAFHRAPKDQFIVVAEPPAESAPEPQKKPRKKNPPQQ